MDYGLLERNWLEEEELSVDGPLAKFIKKSNVRRQSTLIQQHAQTRMCVSNSGNWVSTISI